MSLQGESPFLLDTTVELNGFLSSQNFSLTFSASQYWKLTIAPVNPPRQSLNSSLNMFGPGFQPQPVRPTSKYVSCHLELTNPPQRLVSLIRQYKALEGNITIAFNSKVKSFSFVVCEDSGKLAIVDRLLLPNDPDISCSWHLSIGNPASGIEAEDIPTIDRIIAHIISGKDIVDTQFILYSHRSWRSEGDNSVMVADRPMRLYAKAALLTPRSDYLSSLFNDGFSESQKRSFSGALPPPTEDYGYASDSDLDDSDPPNGSSESDPDEESESHERHGRVVVLKNFAYKTWRAYLLYLHTGKISFAPLKSNTNDEPDMNVSDLELALTSAKSMYRLADQIGDEKLCSEALEHIKSQLTSANIISEAFSLFTSWYPKVRETQTEFLRTHLRSLHGSPAWRQKMEEVARGEYPHAAPILMALTG